MKNVYFASYTKFNVFIILLGFIFLCFNSAALSDEIEEEKVPEKLKYYKEKYEMIYDVKFQNVYDACKKFIEEKLSCQILSSKIRDGENGFLRGIIHSELCVFSQNESEIFKTIQKYALDAPFIRGGVWTSGRMQYTFIIQELEDGKTNLELRGEMSGFENHVTFKAHFFKSNGLLEHQAFTTVEELMGNIPSE